MAFLLFSNHHSPRKINRLILIHGGIKPNTEVKVLS
jgi:hypothetical protein